MQDYFKLKTTLIIMIVLSAVLFMFGCDKKEGTVAPAEIQFVHDYDTALVTAKAKNQYVLVDFYTDWCSWCKVLDTVTYVDSSVIAYSDSIVFAKINAEVDTITAEKYKISSYPSIVLMDRDGNEIDRIGGFLPPDEYLETVHNYLNGIGTLDDYLKRAETEKTAEVYFALGEKYDNRSDFDKAKEYYEKVVEVDPDNKDEFTADAMLSIGVIYARTDKYDQAEKQFKDIMEKFAGTEKGNDAEIYLGYAYRSKGDTTSAIKVYQDFLKNHPESPDTAVAQKYIKRLTASPETEGH